MCVVGIQVAVLVTAEALLPNLLGSSPRSAPLVGCVTGAS